MTAPVPSGWQSPLQAGMEALLQNRSPRPWRAGDGAIHGEAGCIFDADGEVVAAVDVWGNFADEAVTVTAQAIVLAVNAACGYDTPPGHDAL